MEMNLTAKASKTNKSKIGNWVEALAKYPEWTFIIFALLFGLNYVWLTAPFQAPDEYHHAFRSVHVALYNWTPVKYDAGVGGELPQSMDAAMEASAGVWRTRERMNPEFVKKAWQTPLQLYERKYYDFRNTAAYSPVMYLPQAIGIRLAAWLELPMIGLLYAGRVTNLLVWCVIIFWAIRIVPLLKWVMVLLALGPMSTFLSASLSPDALTNATAFLFTSSLLRLASDDDAKPLVWRWYLAIAGLGLLLVNCKNAYGLLFLLLFAVTPKRLGWRKYLVWLSGIVVPSALFLLLWSRFVRTIFMHPVDMEYIDPEAQLQFIRSEPMSFVTIMVDTLQLKWRVYVDQFTGILGWLDTRIPRFIEISYPLLLVLLALAERTQFDAKGELVQVPRISFRIKAIAALVLCSAFVLFHLGLYLMWNEVGAKMVDGFQGRYLIALAPLTCCLFNNRISNRILATPQQQSILLLIYLPFMQLATSLALWNRYHG